MGKACIVTIPPGQNVIATTTRYGVVKIQPNSGITTDGDGQLVFDVPNAQSVLGVGGSSSTSVGTPLVAQRVGDFLNSMGICTHANTFAPPYIDQSNNCCAILPLLQYIGATAIRDGSQAWSAALNAYGYLAANGVRILFTAFPNSGNTLLVSDQVNNATSIMNVATSALLAIEHPNEPPNFNYQFNGVSLSPTSAPGFNPVAQYMASAYTTFKSNTALNGVPVVHTTLGGNDPVDNGLQWLSIPPGYSHNQLTTTAPTATTSAVLAFASVPQTGAQAIYAGLYVYSPGSTSITPGTTVLSVTGTTVTMSANAASAISSGTAIRFSASMPDQTIYSDIANVHVYPMYGATALGRSAASIDPALSNGGNFFNEQLRLNYSAPTGAMGGVGPSFATAQGYRKWITEFGYPTSGASANGYAVDQNTQGKQLLSGWLNAWVSGFERIFFYVLFDTGTPATATNSYGLYTYTGTPKNSAIWLHNFTAILADLGFTRNSFQAGSLAISISNLPPSGTYALFQSSNGTFFLVIWNNVNNWNIAAGTPITIAGTTVSVGFPRIGTINVFDPTVGTAAQSTATAASATLSLADHPMIVSFR